LGKNRRKVGGGEKRQEVTEKGTRGEKTAVEIQPNIAHGDFRRKKETTMIPKSVKKKKSRGEKKD